MLIAKYHRTSHLLDYLLTISIYRDAHVLVLVTVMRSTELLEMLTEQTEHNMSPH